MVVPCSCLKKHRCSVTRASDLEAEVPQQRMVLFQRSSLLPEDLGAAERSVFGSIGNMVGKMAGESGRG